MKLLWICVFLRLFHVRLSSCETLNISVEVRLFCLYLFSSVAPSPISHPVGFPSSCSQNSANVKRLNRTVMYTTYTCAYAHAINIYTRILTDMSMTHVYRRNRTDVNSLGCLYVCTYVCAYVRSRVCAYT